jgi:transcriptional regulator with GAF, ATPase, and Fis domain
METRIVGSSRAIRDSLEFTARVAKSDKSVLLLGETGTGKDLLARRIHELGNRRGKPYVVLNCSSIPEGLFEAELFGFRRGAFTGADRDKPGLLEVANNGTAFLDEVGELPWLSQAKLLRIIDKREIRPVGDTNTKRIGTRFIFATNRDLGAEVRSGRFRMDLYFRISVVQFKIPPLRDRKEDIPLLAAHILEREIGPFGRVLRLTKEALDKLASHDYPGNIRELENILDRASLIAEGAIIRGKDLLWEKGKELGRETGAVRLGVEELKRALEIHRWNKSKTARELKTSRRHLYRLLRKFGITDGVRDGGGLGNPGEHS